MMKPQSKADWDKKMKLRASRQAFLDHKKLAVDSAKEKRKVGGGSGLGRGCICLCGTDRWG